jgi:hypothetical protein
MEQATLYEEFSCHKAARDTQRLKQLAPHISDADPRAAEMLNCIGHNLCIDAQDQAAVLEGLALIQRAAALPAPPLMRAKIHVNIATFSLWDISCERAAEAADFALTIPLEPGDIWLHALAHHHAGMAWLRLRRPTTAEQRYRSAVAYQLEHIVTQHGHIALATFAACRGDTTAVREHLERVVDDFLQPHRLAAQARLALAKGQPVAARELAFQSCKRLTAMQPRPSTRWTQLEARTLYATALAAAGEAAEAQEVLQSVQQLNDGSPYVSVWEGCA